MPSDIQNRSSLTRYAWLSIAAAVLTIGLKTAAYRLTGSVGLLSDALESMVNLIGAIMALAMLTIAARPSDRNHAYGHGKAEYFSSGVEGVLIFAAAASIVAAAVPRLIAPKPLDRVGIGLAVSVAASLVNLFVARIILRAGRNYRSITLEADARHLMTDVWTSAGVLAGIAAVALTGWKRLDPIVACLVAANILRTGFGIVRQSVLGLMDTVVPAEDQEKLRRLLEPYVTAGIHYHALHTRQAGAQQFVTLHVQVPGAWTVERGHRVSKRIEADIQCGMPNVVVFTHLEASNHPYRPKDEQNANEGGVL
jgi:cation diffusion facilitator family transporter